MILFYILAGAFTLAMFAGAVCTVCHAGEKDNICDYSNGGENK